MFGIWVYGPMESSMVSSMNFWERCKQLRDGRGGCRGKSPGPAKPTECWLPWRSHFNTDNIKGENKENKNKILERILNISFWPQRRKEQKWQLKSKCPSHHVHSAAPREKSIKHDRDTGLKGHRAREDLVQNCLSLLRNNRVTNNGEPKASVGGEVFPNLWGSLDEESWKWLKTELTVHFSFFKQESKGSL